MRCIVDWSTEELTDADAWEENARRKRAMLRELASELGERIGFVPVKLTSLTDPKLSLIHI